MRDPTVIVGAHVKCMDDSNSEVSALAFADGRIIATGDRESVLRTAGLAADHANVYDAQGATVIPGFIDAHHHVSVSSLYGGQVSLVAPKVTDIASFQEALAQSARELAPGRWLVATDWDEAALAEGRPPTRAELDDAVGDRPLFALHFTCHRALANSRALELAQIDRNTPDPAGGMISRGRNQIPDGLLIERGMSRVEMLARSYLTAHDTDGFLQRMAAHYRALVAVGITRVADTTVPVDLMPLYHASVARGDVLIPTLVCPVSATGYLEEPWDVLQGPVTGEVFGPLTIGPVKLVFDGAPACAMCMTWRQVLGALARTSALAMKLGSLAPIRLSLSVRPRLGAKVRSGISIYEPESAERVIRELVGHGFSVATHAIGNAAVEVALGAYEAAGASLHDAGIPRLEHATFLDPQLISRIAERGAAVVVQPSMIREPAYASAVSIPSMPFFPLRQLLDAGVLVAGSSDYPVAGFDPLDGVRSAVSRKTSRGVVKEGAERITINEALRMYTRAGAEACGCLDETGTLEVGKRADIVMLDGSLDAPESLRLRQTIVGGAVLFDVNRPSSATK